MKKVIMLLVAVASTATAFAKTGETTVNAANRQEVSVKKIEASFEELFSASCTVSETVYTWGGGSYIVTTTTTCDSCSGAEACATATAKQAEFIAANF